MELSADTLRPTIRAGVLVFALALNLGSTVLADQWSSPTVSEVFSPNRDHFVRVTPGMAFEHVVGFGARPGDMFEPDARYAVAEFFERRDDGSYVPVANARLLNPVAPTEVFVADDGRMITVDNWHNRGYGAIIVVYSAYGDITRAYRLTDLFLADEIDAMSFSASSISWRTGASLTPDREAVFVHTARGEFLFGFESGAFKYCETQGLTYRCRTANADRVWTDNALQPNPR